ncbi:MAG: hypothetical protein CM1200mP15_03680 [Dehalococcoidia bacterium]|nr:MAG: hypothetical protein CM1200mP15_03680 [Dehalococcoidia bacterium]
MAVANILKMPVTGGSDAHSTHGLGKFVTEFQSEIHNETEFLKGLHMGTFIHPSDYEKAIYDHMKDD